MEQHHPFWYDSWRVFSLLISNDWLSCSFLPLLLLTGIFVGRPHGEINHCKSEDTAIIAPLLSSSAACDLSRSQGKSVEQDRLGGQALILLEISGKAHTSNSLCANTKFTSLCLSGWRKSKTNGICKWKNLEGKGFWSVPNQRSVVLSVSISGADEKDWKWLRVLTDAEFFIWFLIFCSPKPSIECYVAESLITIIKQ